MVKNLNVIIMIKIITFFICFLNFINIYVIIFIKVGVHNMIDGLFLQVFSLTSILFLIFIFFSKRRINNIETTVYSALIITNLFGLILHLLSILTITYSKYIPILNLIVTKSYLVYLLVWFTLFTFYVFIISIIYKKKNNIKPVIYLMGVIFLIFLYLIIVLPLYYYDDGSRMYTYGAGVELLYINALIYVVLCLICVIKNLKNLRFKKYFPLLALIIGGGVVMLIQRS